MNLLTVLLSVTAYSAVIYGAILLFRLIFKKHVSPSMMYLVWFLLIARLLIPVTLDSGFSLITIPQVQVSESVTSNVPDITSQDPQQTADTDYIDTSYVNYTLGNNLLQKQSSFNADTSLGLPTLLIGIWILGMALMFIQTLTAAVILRRKLKSDSMSPPDEWFEIAEEIGFEHEMRGRIKILMVKKFVSPALIVSLFPTIVMPENMAKESAQKIEFAFRHEMTHIKRKDHIICLLLAALRIIYWFNPVVWLASSQIRTDMEIACDSNAVKPLNRDETKKYASTVLEMYAERNIKLVLGMALGTTRKTAERRIRGIFMRKNSSFSAKMIATLLSAVLLFACFTTACQPMPESTKINVGINTSPSTSIKTTPVSSKLENSPVTEISPLPTTSSAPSPSPEESPSIEPSDSSEPTASATPKPKTFSKKYYGNQIFKGEWLYYLDLKNPVDSPDSEEPLYYIHRVKKDGSGDEALNILCFRFDFAGKYLYADTNLTFGDFGHWISYRYDLNGDGKKLVDYKDMTRFSNGDSLYFSIFNEAAFYSGTIACTDVKRYEVKVPDDVEIRKKIGYDYEVVFVTVTKEKNGWVYFEFKVDDTSSMPHYTGNYRMNLSTLEIEKTDKGVYE